MGSYCSLSIDDFVFYGSKSYVEKNILSFFCDDDKISRLMVRPDYRDEEPIECVIYAVDAQNMRDRLNIMGFSSVKSKEDYHKNFIEHLEQIQEGNWFRASVEADSDRKWDYEAWKKAIAKYIPLGFQTWKTSEPLFDTPEAKRLGDEYESRYLGSHFSQLGFLLSGILEALPDAKEVVLDITELVNAGYYEKNEEICEEAQKEWANECSVCEPIILLTEGVSDTRILRKAFELIAPHLIHRYGFLDFEEVKLEGSASTLSKRVKSFIAARIKQRMIVIFDNDPAGEDEVKRLSKIPLPPSVKIMKLPNCSIAEAYPTDDGSQGLVTMNLNGIACSIEMYLGSDALKENGQFVPVLLGKGGGGKLSDKNKKAVEDRFFEKIKHLEIKKQDSKNEEENACKNKEQVRKNKEQARKDFPDLAKIIDTITTQFL